jgi:UDP-glucose 4-epimerase
MKNIMIIGANGFLGRQLSIRLCDLGANVTALVAQGSDLTFLDKYSSIVTVPFDLATLDQVTLTSPIDILYHMAWEGVGNAERNNARIQLRNVQYGLSVMEFAQKNGIKRVIIPGSASEYACGSEIISGENQSAPSDMYSAAKVATRFYCQTYARIHSIELIWTAITSIYGPGRDDNNLISYAIKTLLKGEKPSFTGLEQKWDYLYVDDLIEALIALGEKGIGGKIYPIGSGEHQQMVEYVKMIRNQIDPSLPLGIGEVPYKNATIDNQVLDITVLRSEVGFKPKHTFKHGIAKTIAYFKDQMS